MRREDDLAGVDADLLQKLARVAMRKDAIGREIVCRVHEVRLGGGRLARAAHTAFRVGNDAVFQIHQPRGHQRLERQNDGSCVTAGISNKARAGNLCAMQLRHAIDSLRLSGHSLLRAFVLEGIDRAVFRIR